MNSLSVRRPLSLVAVLAMVATMLFAVIGTASAAVPDKTADFSACPTNAGIPDGGFTDVAAGSFFDDAVNCLAYYGVTQGTAAGTYGPADDVTRAQMALFLARSAAAAGVTLKASPPSAGFTDIGGLSAEAQLAINQLADAGIVKGKTATTFSPSDTVLRQQMALFLTRFLGKAIVGPGGTALPATPGASPFTDIGQTTVEASKAINQAWDLGIAAGTTDTTFDPLGNVNRGQMALFLTRLFAHANTRPAGVNIQATPLTGFGTFETDLSVTVRGTDFSPSVNTEVDVWRFNPTTGVTTPFKTDGTCIATNIVTVEGGSAACKVELTDPTMDINGNWPVFSKDATDGATSSFYAWTGAVGSTFDADTTTYSTVTIGSSNAATDATLKSDISKNATGTKVKLGTTVTLTVQLMDGSTTPKPVAKSGVAFIFEDVKTVNGASAGTAVTTLKTDATGKITYTVTQSDPNTAVGDFGVNLVTVTNTLSVAPSSITVNWDDAVATASKVVAATAAKYKVQSNGASNTVTATLYDQYGNPMAGEEIEFTSTDDAADATGVGTVIKRTTNAAGVAILGYNWTHSASTDVTAKEVITAKETDNANTGTANFYWVNAAADSTTAINVVTALVADVANDKVVGVDTEYKVWTWAAGDQFNVGGFASTQAAFETKIALLGTFDVTSYVGTGSGLSVFNAN